MRRLLLLTLGFLCLSGSAFAQTNDCDTAAPTTYTLNSPGPKTVTACWSKKDQGGNTVAPVEWAITIEGIRTVITMTDTGLPVTPGGLYKFTGTTPALVKGTHVNTQIEVVIDDGIGGTISAQLATPFALRVKGQGPQAPTNARVF